MYNRERLLIFFLFHMREVIYYELLRFKVIKKTGFAYGRDTLGCQSRIVK